MLASGRVRVCVCVPLGFSSAGVAPLALLSSLLVVPVCGLALVPVLPPCGVLGRVATLLASSLFLRCLALCQRVRKAWANLLLRGDGFSTFARHEKNQE